MAATTSDMTLADLVRDAQEPTGGERQGERCVFHRHGGCVRALGFGECPQDGCGHYLDRARILMRLCLMQESLRQERAGERQGELVQV